MATIRRGYVTTPLGQVMVRSGGLGKPVVFLTNTYLTSQSLLRGGFLEHLADHFQVFALDTIGQGQSDLPPRVLEISDYADNLADVIDGLGLARPNLVGSHTGASVALEFAVTRPDRVDSLVFAGLPLWNSRQREKLAALLRFQPWSIGSTSEYLGELWQARLGITHGLSPEQMHIQFLEFFAPGPRVHEPIHALFRYEPRDRLPLLKTRTLALAAEGDQFKEQMAEAVSANPLVQSKVLPAGTLLHALDPEAFLTALVEFIG